MPTWVIIPALFWVTLLLVAGGLVLVRARGVIQRIVALDLLATIVISLLALLCYLRGEAYYFDAAVALALLSFVATLAAIRFLDVGGPFG
ncbi:monovalent cation/H+ antiporter complex subunit F [Actinokineospora sp. NPDC004072]